jgi:hypothetical protein
MSILFKAPKTGSWINEPKHWSVSWKRVWPQHSSKILRRIVTKTHGKWLHFLGIFSVKEEEMRWKGKSRESPEAAKVFQALSSIGTAYHTME